MIVVMTVGATLMGIAMSLLIVLFQAEGAGRAHLEQNTSLNRLADQFRRDIHAAVGSLVTENGKHGETVWRFDLAPDHHVSYEAGYGDIVRKEQAGPAVLRRESYTLPANSSATIAANASSGSSIVRLTITPMDAALRPGRELRIDAVPHRDHRFAEDGNRSK